MSTASERRRREELTEVARRAANEARTRERKRCLDLLDHILQHTKEKLGAKLMTETQTQLAELRYRITEAVVREIKGLVFAGIDPKGLKHDNPPAASPGRPDAIRPAQGDPHEIRPLGSFGVAPSPTVDP